MTTDTFQLILTQTRVAMQRLRKIWFKKSNHFLVKFAAKKLGGKRRDVLRCCIDQDVSYNKFVFSLMLVMVICLYTGIEYYRTLLRFSIFFVCILVDF